MSLNIFELEFLLEEINNEILINAILTGIHIGGDEPTLREGVDADMALGDDDESAPPSRILDVIVGRGDDGRLHERAHTESVAEFGKTGENGLFAVEALRVSTVAVNGHVFTKMGCHRALLYYKKKDGNATYALPSTTSYSSYLTLPIVRSSLFSDRDRR